MGNPQFAGLRTVYLGNFLLMAVVFISVAVFASKIDRPGLKALFSVGMKVALASIVISCLVIVFVFFMDRHAVLLYAPANMVEDKSGGLRSLVALNVLLINILACSFASFVASITLQRKIN